MTKVNVPLTDAQALDVPTLQSFAMMEMLAPTMFVTPELENVLLLLVL
jgi:hypothetical protein